MDLYLQDSDNASSTSLIEMIIASSKRSQRGGAAFAFASAGGARLLLEDELFQDFATSGTFHLVVGVDALTDKNALFTIRDLSAGWKSFLAQVFMPKRTGLLFHPKFCWFRGPRSGTLIVGSGNLTEGGMRGNWEAYSCTRLGPSAIEKIEATWRDWIILHEDELYEIDNPHVLERAARNEGWTWRGGRAGGKKRKEARSKDSKDDKRIGSPISSDSVLVAEIPKAGGRWSQANFDLDNYVNFFGAKVGADRHMVFQQVNDDGSPGEVESRPSVDVKSHNFRFELAAATGLDYPAHGRPIGIFVRVAPRTFLYRLTMPSSNEHRELVNLLDKKAGESKERMRRVRLDLEELGRECPGSPMLVTDPGQS
jgi:hypothetical protein